MTARRRVFLEKRTLGSSGIEVSVVGLGCNNFGRRMHDIAAIRAVVHRALDLGVTLFDTADIYGEGGKSEQYLGELLGARRNGVVLATKFGYSGGGSRKSIMRSVEASLKRLRTDTIDLYQMHFPDPRTPIEETMRTLDELVRQGKVRQIGCSNFSVEQVAAAQDSARQHGLAPLVTCQDEYSLLARDIERDLLPLMQQHRMSLLPYRPVASGLLTGKYRRGRPMPQGTRLSPSGYHASEVVNERNWAIVEQLQAIATSSGRSMLDLAFGWLLARPVTASVIAGATTPEQIEQNVRAGEARLGVDELAALDRTTR
jgi:aryl-alcohol dehydrogenase-like predicted oxidoreductase